MRMSAIGETLPLPPGERVGVRGTHLVLFPKVLRRIPLTLTLSPGGRGDFWTLCP
ncbi:hypothetical protein [Azospirillum largimobile]